MSILHDLTLLDADVAISMALVWGGTLWGFAWPVWDAYQYRADVTPEPEAPAAVAEERSMVWWTHDDHAQALETAA